MNHELALSNCTKDEIFQVKQKVLLIARKFISTKKSQYVKKPEVWARAICTKALNEILPEYNHIPFPHLPPNTQKIINNKRWQLDQLLSCEV